MVYKLEGIILVEINIWTHTVSINSSQSWQVFMLTKSFVLEKIPWEHIKHKWYQKKKNLEIYH